MSGLKKNLNYFLQKHLSGRAPLLLALSGGPDSLALFYLLLECDVSFHIAHVDHGWRKESKREAELLEALAKKFSIPFYLHTLNLPENQKHSEECCRNERLQFFYSLVQTHRFQAVLLAHHMNDQTETILKRLFEGGDLTSLYGMKAVQSILGMPLWRPLLGVSKKELVDYLHQRGISFFEDESNSDLRYLRARMREEIIPFLSKHFGKEVGPAIRRLHEDSLELNQLVQKELNPLLKNVIRGPWGVMIDLSNKDLKDPFWYKALLIQLCKVEGVPVRRKIIEQIAFSLFSGHANKKFLIGKDTFYIDRYSLFLSKGAFPELPEDPLLLEGKEIIVGMWKVRVIPSDKGVQKSGWKEVWKGAISVIVPKGEYTLGVARCDVCDKDGHSLGRFWEKHKVPAFLRKKVPVLYQGKKVVHEWLSGVLQNTQGGQSICIQLTLDKNCEIEYLKH